MANILCLFALDAAKITVCILKIPLTLHDEHKIAQLAIIINCTANSDNFVGNIFFSRSYHFVALNGFVFRMGKNEKPNNNAKQNVLKLP